jgi:cellulose synthase/poly-beta-1,6-N-acetylglucosamine synthase-like glycosyltransferase
MNMQHGVTHNLESDMAVPSVSVLLPVYNGAADIERSVHSILNQTFADFELIIINDGSKDNSLEILKTISDPRIRLFDQSNMGLAATLNKGLSLSQGELIARQDQDDLSRPDRLEKQVNYFQQHADCILLGAAAEIWCGDEPTERAHDHPQSHPRLAFELLFNNPFVHSSVMMRRQALMELGGYSTDSTRQPPEDYELWSRMARHGRVANLPERLLIYREVPQSMSRTGPNPFLDRLVTICAENIAFARGLSEVDTVATDIAALTHSAPHRLSRKPDLKAMTQAIEVAAATVSNRDPDVMLQAAERIRILQYQWTIQKTRAQPLMPILRRIRNFGRRLGLF